MAKRRYKTVIQSARDSISEADLDLCFGLVMDALKSSSRRSGQVSIIKGDYKRIRKAEIIGTKDFNDLRIPYNQIAERLILFLSTLSRKHFRLEFREREVFQTLLFRGPKPSPGRSKR